MRVVMRVLVPVLSLAVGGLAVGLYGGCSASAPPGPTTVRGRVTFQGRPVAGGLVVFAPDPTRGGRGKPARGETGPDGTFQLQFAGGPAVPPGWYRVALAAPPGPERSDARPAFPAQLARPDRSNLVREVAPGADHFFEFAVDVPVAGSQ
jgi:hypothetical protein